MKRRGFFKTMATAGVSGAVAPLPTANRPPTRPKMFQINVAEASHALTTCQLRLDRDGRLEILYGGTSEQFGGRWLSVGRTDLKDNVATGGPSNWKNTHEAYEHWIARIRYGARITSEYFWVIDSFSDG